MSLCGRVTESWTAGDGCRRVKPSPSREADVVSLLVLVESEGWEATGMSPILVYCISRCDISGSRVSSNKARHHCSEQPCKQLELEQEQEAARQEHPWRNGRALRTWPLGPVLSCTVVDVLLLYRGT